MDPIQNNMQGVPAHLLHDEVTTGPKAKNIMGKDDFMKLMMTQLQHQDPLNPMDHKEMSTSLAQFGSLEQLTNIGTGIQGLKSGMNESSKLNMLSLIGKTVEATGNELQLRQDSGAILSHVTKEGVVPTSIDIFDKDGKNVRQIQLTGKEQGGKVAWDGRGGNGEKLPPGTYTFAARGVDSKGMGVDLSSNIKGRVVGMDMSGESPALTVATEGGELQVQLARIKSIGTEAEKPVVAQPKADKINIAPPTNLIAASGQPVEVSEESSEDTLWQGRGATRGFPAAGVR